MAETIHQLGQLLFNSIPTILLFLALHFFLKRVLYRPLEQTLAARRERIEGRRAQAQQSVAAAEQMLAGYEASLRERRVANYHHIEAQRQAALALGQQQLQTARHQSTEAITHARQQLATQSADARTHIEAAVESLASQILTQVLHRQGLKPKVAGGASA